jgi:hypothetical protein
MLSSPHYILSTLKSLTVEDMLKYSNCVWSRRDIRSQAVLCRWDEVDRLADQGKLQIVETWTNQWDERDRSEWLRPHVMGSIHTLEELDAIRTDQLSPQERDSVEERLWTTLPLDQLLQRPRVNVANLAKRHEITPEIVELFMRTKSNKESYGRINLILVVLCPYYAWNRWLLSTHPDLTLRTMLLVDKVRNAVEPWHIDEVSSRIPLTVKLVLSKLFRVGYTWSRWGLSNNPTITMELMTIFDTDPKVTASIIGRWNWSTLTCNVPIADLIDNLDKFVTPNELRGTDSWMVPGWRIDGLAQRPQADVDRFCLAYRERYPERYQRLVYHREFQTQLSLTHLLRYQEQNAPHDLIQHHRTLTIPDLYYLCSPRQCTYFGLVRPTSIPNLAIKPWLDIDIVTSQTTE